MTFQPVKRNDTAEHCKSVTRIYDGQSLGQDLLDIGTASRWVLGSIESSDVLEVMVKSDVLGTAFDSHESSVGESRFESLLCCVAREE